MQRSSIIGFDLGGTKSAIARYDGAWNLEQEERIPTGANDGFDRVLERTIALIRRFQTPHTKAVGIGVPGLVSSKDGVILSTPNIPGGSNVRLKTTMSEALGLPVFVQNDARCFTLAEATHGAGKGKYIVVGITMGTGVGGGIVVDGGIFGGDNGYAGEIGHMLLQPGHPPFPTGDTRGEIEQFLSGTAWGKRCEAATRPEDYLDGEVCSFLRPDIFREVAWMVTSITHLLDPSIIVFGGSSGKALKPYLTQIEAELKQWTLPGTPLPELAVAEREDSGTLGAALLAKNGAY